VLLRELDIQHNDSLFLKGELEKAQVTDYKIDPLTWNAIPVERTIVRFVPTPNKDSNESSTSSQSDPRNRIVQSSFAISPSSAVIPNEYKHLIESGVMTETELEMQLEALRIHENNRNDKDQQRRTSTNSIHSTISPKNGNRIPSRSDINAQSVDIQQPSNNNSNRKGIFSFLSKKNKESVSPTTSNINSNSYPLTNSNINNSPTISGQQKSSRSNYHTYSNEEVLAIMMAIQQSESEAEKQNKLHDYMQNADDDNIRYALEISRAEEDSERMLEEHKLKEAVAISQIENESSSKRVSILRKKHELIRDAKVQSETTLTNGTPERVLEDTFSNELENELYNRAIQRSKMESMTQK
jgi:hypothetical protein